MRTVSLPTCSTAHIPLRNVRVVRIHLPTLVLASQTKSTPSIEGVYNARNGRVRLLAVTGLLKVLVAEIIPKTTHP